MIVVCLLIVEAKIWMYLIAPLILVKNQKDLTKYTTSENKSFYHVVFDPPHVRNISMRSVTGFSYGSLNKETWKDDLQAGFKECFRVLKANGTLIFKWNEIDIPLREVLALTKQKPLYGHRSGKTAKTHWVAFIKGDDEGGQ